MGNVSPITVPAQVSNIQNFPDLVRFVASFAKQVSDQFNNLLSTKSCWGSIGISGQVNAGSSNFSCSLITTGTYLFAFRQTRTHRPAISFGAETFGIVRGASITAAGFVVLTSNASGTLSNFPFSFIVTGAK